MLDDYPGFRIHNWLFLKLYFVWFLDRRALSCNGLEDDCVRDLQMFDHSRCSLVVVTHGVLTNLTNALSGISGINNVVFPHLAPLRPSAATFLRTIKFGILFRIWLIMHRFSFDIILKFTIISFLCL